MRSVFWSLSVVAILSACGGGQPEAETTWETHTTSAEDEAGGEEGASEEAASEEAPAEP